MKTLVWAGLVIGSTIGSYIPTFFGADLFSMWSVLAGAIGGIIGIWLGVQTGK